MSTIIRCTILTLALLLSDCTSAADTQAGSKELARQLIGTWILVGTPEKIGEPPAAGGRLRFFTGRHWIVTESDPKTGEVIFEHGGTYTFEGALLDQKVEYAKENTKMLIGEHHKFKITIVGDTLTQIGIGNSWNEVWKR